MANIAEKLVSETDTAPANDATANPNGAGPIALPNMPPAAPRRFTVEQVVVGANDSRGVPIRRVFYKRSAYAIYEAERLRLQLSDDDALADRQFDLVAPMFPLRDRLEYLTTRLKNGGDYKEQIANGFNLALEEQPELAREIVIAGIENATEERTRTGRLGYLGAAGIFAIALMAVLWGCAWLVPMDNALAQFMQSAGAGAAGALLSIALAIRARTVAPDLDSRANMVDAGLRILIGVFSGAVIYLLLATGIISSVWADGARLGGQDAPWQATLLVGVVAGFLERLVPDILEKAQPSGAAGAAASDPTPPAAAMTEAEAKAKTEEKARVVAARAAAKNLGTTS